MATKLDVTVWEAKDGSRYYTEEEADRHDFHTTLQSAIEELTCYGNVDPDQLFTELTTGKLGKLVHEYHGKL